MNDATTTSPGRRTFLGIAAATVAVAASPSVVAAQTVPVHPDAELIRVCGEHRRAQAAFNACPYDDDTPEGAPLWEAYSRAHARVGELRATTMEGVRAKYLSILAENPRTDGRVDLEGTAAAGWLVDLFNDVLAMRA